MKATLSFAAGFVLAALLFGSGVSSAQDKPALPPGVAEYLAWAGPVTMDLDRLVGIGLTSLDKKTKMEDVTKAQTQLADLLKDARLQHPPLEVTALHTQLEFAAKYCEGLFVVGTGIKQSKQPNMFDGLFFLPVRDTCADHLLSAKLRLLDYATTRGINPFVQP